MRVSIFLAGLAGCAALSGCGVETVAAKATVSTIDRTCEIIETTTREVDDPRTKGAKLDAAEMETKTGECKSVAEWDEVRTKRTKKVEGTALVHVDYIAPQDGRTHSATLEFDGRDDEFYELRAGDEIDIRIAKTDPTRIRKA
jgi:hypothetical protein